jgi:hypothetical protein
MKGTHMKQLKYILPLLLTILTLAIYKPIETQASTTQYNLTYSEDTALYSNGSIATASDWTSTNLIEIINNSIIINNQSLVSKIGYFNGNTYISQVTLYGNNNTLSIPSNATHFILSSRETTSDYNSQISSAQFQTLIVSYTTPAPAEPFTQDTIPSNLLFGGNLDTWTQSNYKVDKITGQLTQDSNYKYLLFSLASENPYVSSRPVDLNEYDAYVSFYDWQFNYISSSNLTNTFINQLSNFPSNARYAVKSYETAYLPSNVSPSATSWNVEGSPKVIFLDYDGSIKYQNYFQKPNDVWGPAVAGYVEGELFTDYFPGPTALQSQQFLGWVPITILQPTSTIDLPIGLTTNSYTPDINENNVVSQLSNATAFRSYYFYPVYEQLVTYTVTFLDYDGTNLGTDTVVDGFPANPPLVPTRTGYTFNSWLPPIAQITGDITTVAQYTANTYLVTWTSDNIEVKTGQAPHDSTILSHAPAITKENNTLIGWRTEPTQTLVTSGQVVTGSLSLTAVWEAVPTYTVTWRDTDFSTLKIEYVIQSGLAVAPTYVADSGLQLVGWTPDPTQPITQNTTFIAVVEQIPTTPTLPSDYSPISDLFGGVIGASIGAVMTLGTIDLYGIQLSSIIYLFISMSLGLWILKAIRG